MTPHKLALAFSRLHLAIGNAQAPAVLQALLPYATEPRPSVEALLRVFATLSSAQAQFGEPERSLLTAFGLQAITDTAWWATLLTACARGSMNDTAASMVEEVHARLQTAADTFPALAGLVDRAQAVPLLEPGGIVVLLPGVDGAPPSLLRVASAIESLNQLWTVAEELTGHRSALCLTGTVPGATMAFHFDGDAEPLAELRALLVSIWEQTARLSKVPPEQHPALVAEMLPVMHRIGQSGRSDALRVRGVVEAGVRRLLEAGCTLPVETRGYRPMAGSAPGSKPPASGLSISTAAVPSPGRVKPASDKVLDEEGMSHLAAVIAEERSQLRPMEPSRRMWQDTEPHQA